MSDILLNIKDPTHSFNDIVSDPQIVKLYKSNDSVYAYFKSHYFELLDYSLGHHNSTYGYNSYEILILGDTDILEPILKSEIFFNRAIEIINSKNSESFLIGRLSHIMLTSFLFLPELSINTFSFIIQLLQFSSNTSVLDLFANIVSKEEYFSKVQCWLLKIGFIDQIISELNSIDYEYVSNEQIQYFDVVYEKVFGLYFILRKCSLSSIFSDNLFCKEMIQILTKSFVNHPLYVENARWETILVLTTKKTSKIMLPIVPDVIEVIKKDVDVLPAYVAFAIEIVSKMMDFSVKAADIVFESRVLIDILNLVKKFCSCTELFKSFHKFIVSFLKHTKKITPKMLLILLQFILDFAKTRENKVLAPFCIGFLELLIDAGERNKKILKAINHCEGCREFINGEYVEYKKMVDANYGFDMELTDEQN